jgi:hypothetical protein
MSARTAAADYDSVVLADDPVAYWRMDGAATGRERDASNHGLIGSYSGRRTQTTLPNGEPAADFDGATGYLTVGDDAALSPATTGQITLEAWIRPDALQFPNDQGTGYVHWMGKGEPNQHEYVARMYSKTNDENRPNRVSGYAFNPAGNRGAGSFLQDPVTTGDWIHYALVINTEARSTEFPNGYTKIYRDGALRDQDDLSIDGNVIRPVDGTAPFRVGTRDFGSWFAGAIGKVAVYDQELPRARIAAHTDAMITSA